METNLPVFVAIGSVCLGAWLFFGFIGYGMLFAFFQRQFTKEEAAKDLYKDMWEGLRFVPQGFIGLVKVVNYLIEHGGWDEENSDPTHGYKFLPRHEYRY